MVTFDVEAQHVQIGDEAFATNRRSKEIDWRPVKRIVHKDDGTILFYFPGRFSVVARQPRERILIARNLTINEKNPHG